MTKTRKVLEVNDVGHHYICVKHDGDMNPYRVYATWYDGGWHRKQIAKYADMVSVLFYLYDRMARTI